MRFLGNVLWLVLAGWWLALGYVIAGAVACLLIITIPFGVQAFKLAGYALWPFGRVVVQRPDASPTVGIVANIVWIILPGGELAVAHLVAGVLLCLSVVGIPLGIACFKLIPLALVPFGKVVVPADSVDPAENVYGSAFRLG